MASSNFESSLESTGLGQANTANSWLEIGFWSITFPCSNDENTTIEIMKISHNFARAIKSIKHIPELVSEKVNNFFIVHGEFWSVITFFAFVLGKHAKKSQGC